MDPKDLLKIALFRTETKLDHLSKEEEAMSLIVQKNPEDAFYRSCLKNLQEELVHNRMLLLKIQEQIKKQEES